MSSRFGSSRFGAAAGRWWALGAIALALLAVGLDVTVLNVALPSISVALHASTGQLQWFASGYALVMAALLLPAGMLGDRYGRRRLQLAALVLFGAASWWCSAAASPTELIAARVALGVTAAFLTPLSMAVLLELFPAERDRQKAIAVLSGAMMLGLPLGPVLGGYLLQHFWWGSVFLINPPLVVLACVAVALLVPESYGDRRRGMDVVATLLSSIGLVGVTYGVIAAGEHSWTSVAALVPLLGGAGLLLVLPVWERRLADPLIDPTLFRAPGFAWGTVLVTLVGFSMFGLMFVLPLYFQDVQGSDTLATGLKLLPLIGGLLVGAGLAGRAGPATGRALLPAVGFGLMATGLLIGSATSATGGHGFTTGYGFTAGWLVVLGMGLGIAMTRTMTTALGALPTDRAGVGSALMQAVRQVGGALGVALLGAFANTGYRDALHLHGLPTAAADMASRSVSTGVGVAERRHRPDLLAAVRVAFVHAMDTALLISASIAALAALLTLVALGRHAPRPPALLDDRPTHPAYRGRPGPAAAGAEGFHVSESDGVTETPSRR